MAWCSTEWCEVRSWLGVALSGVRLDPGWCDPGMATFGMVQALHNDRPYVMLLGAGCSVCSEATSQVSYLWNLTQFSYGSSSPTLSNRKRFPRFFRLALPDQKLNSARLDLMNEFSWKKVATINQALEFFSAVIEDFVQSVEETDISIISQEIFVNDPYQRVKNLKKHDARIIMTAMYEDKARQVLCAAYQLGLYGPKIIWVFVGWYSANFWQTNLDNIDCTEEEMSAAAEGSFITGPVYKNPVEERGLANITAQEFDERYFNYPTYNPASKNYDFYAHQCYDHIWVAAKTLNCSITKIHEQGLKDLDQFTYTDSDLNDVIFECMSSTSLTGVSGRVVFSKSADPNRVVKMERIQGQHIYLRFFFLDGVRQPIGLYRQDQTPKYFEWIEGAIKWKDNVIPRDSTYITMEEIKIPLTLYIPMITLSGIGLCLTVLFFVFNIVYRNNSYVKMSSPNINNVLLVGCVLCYSTVFFKTTEIEHAAVCQTIKDYQLLAIICAMVGVVLCVLIIWEAVGPHTKQIKLLPKENYMSGADAEVHPFVRICVSEYASYFGWALYIIQGSLLSFGTFLAWETRHVKIQALNDSHEIGLCVYNVIVLSAVGLTLSLLLTDQEVLMYGVTSGALILGTTMTQIVIFIPKIQAVKNNVSGNDVTNRIGTTIHPTTSGPPSQTIPTVDGQKNNDCVA
ncbi:G-protein coupled GABA receptor [Mactra antiquata]